MESDAYLRAQKEGKLFAIIGVAGQFGALFVGFLLLVFQGFYLAYVEPSGQTNQASYSAMDQAVMIALVLSAIVYLFGWGFVYKAMFKKRYRAPWFFWMTFATCVLAAFLHPIGLAIGGLLVLWMLDKRREFFGPTQAAEN